MSGLPPLKPLGLGQTGEFYTEPISTSSLPASLRLLSPSRSPTAQPHTPARTSGSGGIQTRSSDPSRGQVVTSHCSLASRVGGNLSSLPLPEITPSKAQDCLNFTLCQPETSLTPIPSNVPVSSQGHRSIVQREIQSQVC